MNIQQFLNTNDHFAVAAGCRIIEIGEGRAVATMLVTHEHLNAGGVCQGGALFTLADLAFPFCGSSYYQPEGSIVMSCDRIGI